MDKEEKKRISNEKRLRAVREWNKNRTLQKRNLPNSPKVFDSSTIINEENERKSLDSNEKEDNYEKKIAIQPRPQFDGPRRERDRNTTINEENEPKLQLDSNDEEDNYEANFGPRPQFHGPIGEKVFEMSVQTSKLDDGSRRFKSDDGSNRFKLDERFKEDETPDLPADEMQEKEKNLEILRAVIGHHKVFSKASNKSLSKMRQIRFDPEDESSSKYIKISKTPIEKPRKKKSKKGTAVENEEPSIPVSTERYIEVSSNLKEILSSSAAPFSFIQKFNHDGELDGIEFPCKSDVPDTDNIVNDEEIKIGHLTKEEEKQSRMPQELGSRYFIPRMKPDSFFILEGDPRLKEGITLFKRKKPLEDIREEWQREREHVLDLFRKKRKSAMRSHFTKVQDIQKKNAIRKQN